MSGRNPLQVIGAMAERMRAGSPGSRFADQIPPSAILVVALSDIDLVILRAIAGVKPGSTVSRDMATRHWADGYPREMRGQVERRLLEAWQRLVNGGLIADKKVMGTFETWFVTELGEAALQRGTVMYGDADLLPVNLLLPDLAKAVGPLYAIGRFDDACAAAFKQLEIIIRTLCELPDDVVGLDLMRKAFTPEVGRLSLRKVPVAEQHAVRDLFVGAFGYFRNPLAHRSVAIESAAHGASTILFANELMAIARRHARDRQAEDAKAEADNGGT